MPTAVLGGTRRRYAESVNTTLTWAFGTVVVSRRTALTAEPDYDVQELSLKTNAPEKLRILL